MRSGPSLGGENLRAWPVTDRAAPAAHDDDGLVDRGGGEARRSWRSERDEVLRGRGTWRDVDDWR